ncbi:hypothetical protein GCM10027037_00960 [Mucilaginibacter koreensis]
MAGLTACKKDKTEDNPTTQTPEITSVQPKNPQTGDVVTITGFRFGSTATDVKVTLGNTAITVSSVTDTEIKFTVPAAATSGSLTVSVKGITAANKDSQGTNPTVTPKPVAVPTFTALSPATGKAGDIVTLTGTNFSTVLAENVVKFATATSGTTVVATVKTATATTLTAEIPATASTGTITIAVNGTNAAPAAGFTPTFTVSTGSATGGTSVSYVNVVSGTLNFSKIGTAANEIGTMWYDKIKNQIYYSDYTLATSTGSKVYKLDPGGNSAPQVLTADARITNVTKIATDAAGNVYTLRYENKPNTYSLYKITPDGAAVTEIKTNFSSVSDNTGIAFLFVNTANEICLRPNFKIKPNGDIVTGGASLPGLQPTTEGAVFNSSTAYVAYTTDNSGYSNTCTFAKWNLDAGTTADASFSLKTLFNDDADRIKSTRQLGYLRYAVDDSENFYALIDQSNGTYPLAKTWVIRKAKNGTAGYTTLGSFYIKFPTVDLNDITGTVMMVSDARGNLYIKANQKDILRITQ